MKTDGMTLINVDDHVIEPDPDTKIEACRSRAAGLAD
jgi:hypothetical protein